MQDKKENKNSTLEDEADFSSFKNALSVVTRRFKVAAPIKNSQYHKDWNDLIQSEDTLLIDVRNKYETDIGSFNQAITPESNSFVEFKNFIDGASLQDYNIMENEYHRKSKNN